MRKLKGIRKKTSHPIQEVYRVLKKTRTGESIVQRGLRKPFEIDGIPDGHFCNIKGRIYCPKKRGETILIAYTTVLEEEI